MKALQKHDRTVFYVLSLLLVFTNPLSFADENFGFQDPSNLTLIVPDGITNLAAYEFAISTPVAGHTDGNLLRIRAKQGEGVRILVPNALIGDGKVFIEASINVQGPGLMIAIAALDNELNGDFSTLNGSGSFLIDMDTGRLQTGWQKFSTLYDPPRGGVVPLLQVVGTSESESLVEIDNLRVIHLNQAVARGEDIAQILGVSIPAPAPSPTPTPAPIGSLEANQVLARVNYHRTMAGISPLQLNASLLIAAQAHSEYMAINNILEHVEDITLPGFTGARSWDRATAAGYPNTYIAEDVGAAHIQIANPINNVDLQMEGPFHRVPLLHSGMQHLGYGSAISGNTEYHTFNFGSFGRETMQPVYYPGNSQTDVPLAFGGYEFPDPFPGSFYPIGYPITLFVAHGSSFKVFLYSIREVGGNLLPLTALLPGDIRGNQDTSNIFAMASTTPLKPGTLYEASIESEIDGERTTKTWQFTTRSDNQGLRMILQGSRPYPSISVELSDNTRSQ